MIRGKRPITSNILARTRAITSGWKNGTWTRLDGVGLTTTITNGLQSVLGREAYTRLTLPELGQVLGTIPVKEIPEDLYPAYVKVYQWLLGYEAGDGS